jgi:hypothetical protein
MFHPKLIHLLAVVVLVMIVSACSFAPANPVQTENVEATIVAHVEATLVANSVAIEQKVHVTLTAIADATQTAVALLPTTTPTSEPTATPTPVPINIFGPLSSTRPVTSSNMAKSRSLLRQNSLRSKIRQSNSLRMG